MARYKLTAAGQKTPWIELLPLASPISFIVTGFTGSITLQYSNNEDYEKGTDLVTDETAVTADVLREIPFGIAKFVRFSLDVLTTGSPIISFARGKDGRGTPIDVGEQPKPAVVPYP